MGEKDNQEQRLFPEVKTYLNITWADPDTDARVRFWIQSGIAYLDKKRGAPTDYMQPSLSKTLLFEYARYMRDSALDVFENNYRSMILSMQHERAVSVIVEKTVSKE